MNKLTKNINKILTFVYIIYFGLLLAGLFKLIHPYSELTIIQIISFVAMLLPAVIILIIVLKPNPTLNRKSLSIPLLIFACGQIAVNTYTIIISEVYVGIYYIILDVTLVVLYLVANRKDIFYMLLCVFGIVLVPQVLNALNGNIDSLLATILLLTTLLGAYNDYKELMEEDTNLNNQEEANGVQDNEASMEKPKDEKAKEDTEANEN